VMKLPYVVLGLSVVVGTDTTAVINALDKRISFFQIKAFTVCLTVAYTAAILRAQLRPDQ